MLKSDKYLSIFKLKSVFWCLEKTYFGFKSSVHLCPIEKKKEWSTLGDYFMEMQLS